MTETMSSNPCRICMGSKMNQISIFINDLSRKLTEIADVEVQEGDGLPPTICEDCELDLEKCFKFREQIQWADSKFRESLSVSEVVFEECQIKQEVGPMHTFMNDDNQDQIEDDDDDRGPSDNDEDYEMRDDPEDKTENAEKERNQVTHPLDHVEIIEHRTKQEIHIASTDQNSQEEPLIVAQNMKSENEPTSDPLMHTEPQSMDTDNNMPGPSTSASTVYGTEHPKLEKYHIQRRSMMQTEDGLDSSQESLKQNQLALNFLEEQQMYNPELQTSTNEFGHFMASHGQTAQPTVGLLKGILLTKKDMSQTDTPPVIDESLMVNESKPASLQPETNPESQTKRRTLPKRLQNLTKAKSPTPTKPRVRNRKKVAEKPFQIHDDATCFVCNIFCGNIDVLGEHLKSVKNVCRVCTKAFDSHTELEQHFMTHKPSICDSCGVVNHCKADYYKHLRENAACNSYETDLKCDVCDKKFLRKRTLRIHKIQQHTNVEAKFKCVVCEKPFNLTWMLNLHLSKVHFVSEHVECQLCHRIFLGKESLKNHMNLKHFSGLEAAKSYQCNICNKDFNKESSLVSHMKHRHDKTESLCEDCGVSVFGYKAMQEHRRMNHPKENETFICEICVQTFDNYKLYRQHRKMLHHKRSGPVFCEICGKEFKTASTLRHHYAVHRDERKFECEVCGAAFKQKVALKTHCRVHTEAKQYVCHNCGESFRWKQTFDKHVKTCLGAYTQGHMIE